MLVLYGLACAQVMYYYYHYRTTSCISDVWYDRVAVLWVIETATVVLDSQVAHTVVISKHATRSLLSSPIPELSFIEFVLGATAVLVVQFFYLHGTWTLSNKRWYTKMTIAFMVLIALLSLGMPSLSVKDLESLS
ncbi:uncharacterized protein B0H18DRAFT_323044 [Fomitopsis serialis]|uniref:uncharacterized protein n=1 Tax=Fomitopsis serialis TaxID=139415 RepID=UPI0020082FC5|nr:uncharacterized protein B0H18DRAFT_323044 [Neoantrodia serialis]KAH9936416.1 hypothetical protein B0H18DRAFT_323044 [Neoantrodia serialis]